MLYEVITMAEYCISLLSDDKLAERMKKACLDRARNDFGSDRITSIYEAIYYRVLDREVPGLTSVS